MIPALARPLVCTLRQSHLYWKYVANWRACLNYRLGGAGRLTPVAAGIVRSLRRSGIAITSATELFGQTDLFDELAQEVSKLERDLAADIERARRQKDDEGFKRYLVELLGPRPVLDPASIFVRMALASPVLEIANGYFGMMSRLRFYNVWRNFSSASPARNSQLWHRDPEDRYILKMFVYLSDVDDGAGPMFYAPGTHGYGNVVGEPRLRSERGTTALRAADADMEAIVGRDKWVKAEGPKGTIVFVDTRGYHKGGLARTQDRLVYNCMFTSGASTRGDYFERPADARADGNGPKAHALGMM